jgi:hypothetical protein
LMLVEFHFDAIASSFNQPCFFLFFCGSCWDQE